VTRAWSARVACHSLLRFRCNPADHSVRYVEVFDVVLELDLTTQENDDWVAYLLCL